MHRFLPVQEHVFEIKVIQLLVSWKQAGLETLDMSAWREASLMSHEVGDLSRVIQSSRDRTFVSSRSQKNSLPCKNQCSAEFYQLRSF